ncbi:MAG: hypothetical protein M1822_003438 [Bathelium mastoideum]|nr:MAG: hypothetical protein M1822_003438 [Bathelium mastoideum]
MAVSLQDAIAVRPESSHSYVANVPLDHCYGAGKRHTAHGGLLTSVIQSAIKQHFGHTLAKYRQPDTLDLSLAFLRPATSGHCTVHIKELKLGPVLSQVSFSLVQGSKERIVGWAAITNLTITAGISHPTVSNISPRPVDFAAIARDGRDCNWVAYTIPWHRESVIKPVTHFQFLSPREPLAENSVTTIWMRFSESNKRFTTEMLGSVADHWHRMPENYLKDSEWNNVQLPAQALKNPGGSTQSFSTSYLYPTLSLHLEIKKPLPAEGIEWLFVHARSYEIKNGKFDANVTILDESLELVALSHQVCFVLPGKQSLDSKI